MPGPGMELIGEEEIQEVIEVLRGGYLFRYGVSLGTDVDPDSKAKFIRRTGHRPLLRRALRGRGKLGYVGAVQRR